MEVIKDFQTTVSHYTIKCNNKNCDMEFILMAVIEKEDEYKEITNEMYPQVRTNFCPCCGERISPYPPPSSQL